MVGRVSMYNKINADQGARVARGTRRVNWIVSLASVQQQGYPDT